MKARIAASVLAIGLAVGLSGCGMVTPVATNIQYNASDGVSANLGEIAIRNAMVITADSAEGSDNGNLVFTAVNPTGVTAEVKVQYMSKLVRKTVVVEVPEYSTLALGIGKNEPIALTGIDTPAGGNMEIFFQAGSAEGKTVLVPVLDTTLIEYQDLGPAVVEVAPSAVATATPSPTASASH